jgi:hypothetical protein
MIYPKKAYSAREITGVVKRIFKETYEVESCRDNQAIPSESGDDLSKLAEFLDNLQEHFRTNMPSEIFPTIEDVVSYIADGKGV